MRFLFPVIAAATVSLAMLNSSHAAPTIAQLTPPSRPATGFGSTGAVIARFLPDQRFDLQATVTSDAGQTISRVRFFVDDALVADVSGSNGAMSLVASASGLPANTAIASLRAYSNNKPGVHTLRVEARQNNGLTATRRGVFEIVKVSDKRGKRAKNVIILIGDGMGIAHRTAARILMQGISQGKANGQMAMDSFPYTGLVVTSSLNSIVTDSAPGAHCYSTGNKANNNQEGVFPDATAPTKTGTAITDPQGSSASFDNPRIENIGEYLFRKYGKTTGIVTTADVFDATPAAFGVHTQDRGAGTGIIDQFLAEAARPDGSGYLRVLMGGGRKWFLPSATPGSGRSTASDYVLPSDVATGWGVPAGGLNAAADVLADFRTAGFAYAPTRTALKGAGTPDRLLGLFSLGNMNITLDKIAKQRGTTVGNLGGKNGESFVVDDYGFPDQPMLDEMTAKALEIMSKNPKGFTLMVEGASIDKQSHNMDTDRWMLDVIEFDRAIKVAQDFAKKNPDTLVIVTADHECAGVNIIGASRVKNADLVTRSTTGTANNADPVATLRNDVVGVYEEAGFPQYTLAPDGYPITTDPDYRLLIGYAANSDRNEDWLTNPLPLQDSQQPFVGSVPLSTYPKDASKRDVAGGFVVRGQIPGSSAVHTASDIPLSAFGRGSSLFTGVMDNTDVYFKIMQAVVGGAD